MANLGAQQLVQRGEGAALKLIELLKADGICIHLNAAQELVQGDGDRDFRGCLEAIAKLAEQLGEKLIVKETGCGLSPATVHELARKGVRTVDVSGLGGTSWPRVEQLRAKTPAGRELGGQLSGWGIPTAACVAATYAVVPEVRIIASGGIRDGFDAAKALALGADIAGVALPFVRAHHEGGIEAARALLQGFVASLKAALLLCGAKDVTALRASKPIILEPLRSWIDGLAT
jgi:isopentenyl-diphosphate delta-isomerase